MTRSSIADPNQGRKSAGGVFMTLLKSKIPKDIVRQILKVEHQKQKEKKHCLRQLENMMDKSLNSAREPTQGI